jgi:hypothetical protein
VSNRLAEKNLRSGEELEKRLRKRGIKTRGNYFAAPMVTAVEGHGR